MLCFLVSFIGAFVLQLATRSLYEIELPYKKAFESCIVLLVITNILAVVFGGVMGLWDEEFLFFWGITSLGLSALFLGLILKKPESGAIGIPRGFVLGLILMPTLLLIFVLLLMPMATLLHTIEVIDSWKIESTLLFKYIQGFLYIFDS